MRPHHPWYRAATNSWYVEINGQQQLLGKHPDGSAPPRKRKRGDPPLVPPKEIQTVYHRIMAADPAHLPRADDLRVAVICDLFLGAVCPYEGDPPKREPKANDPQPLLKANATHDVRTYWGYRSYLQDFCKLFGALPGKDLKPLHVTRWLDSHSGWKGSRRNAVVAIKRAFNWAEAEGVLQPNPIKAVKKPPQPPRDRVLTQDEGKAILAAIKDQSFRDFVFAMMETGARPGEVRRVTAQHVNLALGVWTFAEHKTGKRNHRNRPEH